MLSWGVRQQPCRIRRWTICRFRRGAADHKFRMWLHLFLLQKIICSIYERIVVFTRWGHHEALLPLDHAFRLSIRIIHFLMLHPDYRRVAAIYLTGDHRCLGIGTMQARLLLLRALQLPHVLWLLCWYSHELLVLHIGLGSWIEHLHAARVVFLLCFVATILDPHLLLPALKRVWLACRWTILLFILQFLIVFLFILLNHVSKQGGILMSSQQVAFGNLSLMLCSCTWSTVAGRWVGDGLVWCLRLRWSWLCDILVIELRCLLRLDVSKTWCCFLLIALLWAILLDRCCILLLLLWQL